MPYLRALVMGICCVAVTGCMLWSEEYRQNRFAETCARYGFEPGTVAYTYCLPSHDSARVLSYQ